MVYSYDESRDIAVRAIGMEQRLSTIVVPEIIKTIETQAESRREWLLYMFKYFAKKNTNNRTFQFWIQDNHPIALYHPNVIWQKLDYIHMNPVRAKIVENPVHYLYSSARDYQTDTKGLIEVLFL